MGKIIVDGNGAVERKDGSGVHVDLATQPVVRAGNVMVTARKPDHVPQGVLAVWHNSNGQFQLLNDRGEICVPVTEADLKSVEQLNENVALKSQKPKKIAAPDIKIKKKSQKKKRIASKQEES